MENTDKGLIVPKWVLLNWPKIPQITKIYLPKLSAQDQTFDISIKQGSLGVRSPCLHRLERLTVTKETMTLKFL